jgi:hypothetical protein
MRSVVGVLLAANLAAARPFDAPVAPVHEIVRTQRTLTANGVGPPTPNPTQRPTPASITASCTPGWNVAECLDAGTLMYGDMCDSCDDCGMYNLTAATGGRYTCDSSTNTLYYDPDLDSTPKEDGTFEECWYNRCEEGCYNEWPEFPGDHPYDVFTDSGKCRMRVLQEWAHNEEVGTVADIAECWNRCQDLNSDGKTSFCASMHQTSMECSCQGADPKGDFDELECLEDVGEYTLAVHEGWRGSSC